MFWSSVLPPFLASIVEFVEALTIVLVVGVTINWKSSLLGAAAATGVLAALVAVFGYAIVKYIDIEVLRTVIGVILILFGMQWLIKSILRYSGIKALHDESEIYQREMRELQAHGGIVKSKFNAFGFVTAFKSVLLEGLEVAFIVITFGIPSAVNAAGRVITEAEKANGVFLASIGAFFAFLIVLILGLAIHKPLTKVPENTLKFMVGIMLVTFGVFWTGEGLGVVWKLDKLVFDGLTLIVLVDFFLLFSAISVKLLKNYVNSKKKSEKKTSSSNSKPNILLKIWNEIFDFFCGNWSIFWGTAITLAVVRILQQLVKTTDLSQQLFGYLLLIGVSTSLYIALRRAAAK